MKSNEVLSYKCTKVIQHLKNKLHHDFYKKYSKIQ